MSWTDKELDELARKAEANQTFAYEDSFWTEMEAMLPVQKKRKWPIFMLALIPVVGVLAFYELADSPILEVSNGAKTMEFASLASTGNSSLSTNNSGNTSAANLPSTVSTSSNFSNLSAEQTEKGNSTNLPNARRNISVPQLNPTNEKGVQKMAIAAKELPNNWVASEVEKTDKTALISAVEKPENESRNGRNEAVVTTESISKAAAEVEEEQVGIDRLPIALISLFTVDNALNPTTLRYRSARPFYSVFTEIGVGMGETYAAGQIGHTEAMNLTAGARYTNKRFFVQAGVGLEWEKAKLELCERSKVYKTSSTTYENRFSYKEMFRILVPLSVGYTLGKHVVQVGVTPTYLLGTKLNYSYFENDNLKRDELRFGNTEGWKTFGLKTNIGYGYNLFPSTTIGANFQVQLINQLEKNWVNNINRYPISGQLFIRRTIR
ncbi:MAG: hypothetical protein WC044_02230 [Crocinitomicaceae bacterium]